jgi:hypothetical protein
MAEGTQTQPYFYGTSYLTSFRLPTRRLRTARVLFSNELSSIYAAPGCPSSGHHRAISYVCFPCIHTHKRAQCYWGKQDMLDITLIVRFEVDACLPTATDAGTEKTGKKPSVKKAPELGLDDLVDALGDVNLTSSPTATTPTTTSFVVPIASPRHYPCGHTSTPRIASRGDLALKVFHRSAGLERALSPTRDLANTRTASRRARARHIYRDARMPGRQRGWCGCWPASRPAGAEALYGSPICAGCARAGGCAGARDLAWSGA